MQRSESGSFMRPDSSSHQAPRNSPAVRGGCPARRYSGRIRVDEHVLTAGIPPPLPRGLRRNGQTNGSITLVAGRRTGEVWVCGGEGYDAKADAGRQSPAETKHAESVLLSSRVRTLEPGILGLRNRFLTGRLPGSSPQVSTRRFSPPLAPALRSPDAWREQGPTSMGLGILLRHPSG